MVFPFYALAQLAVESSVVINRRLARIGQGGTQATDEIQLMVVEKAQAAVEAATTLMLGGTVGEMVARFREHVAANDARLRNGL